MKKLVLAFIVVIITTGCTKKMICTLENEDSSNSFKSLVTIKYEDDVITNVTYEMEFSNKEAASNMCEIYKGINSENGSLKCSDNKITINDYHLSLDESILEYDVIKSYYTNQGYECE